MKRHIQNSGFKKWFGNYFVELESEPLKAIDQWASAYEGCIISGVLLSLISGTTYNVAAGMVVLKIDDEYKVAPLLAANNVNVSVQKAIRLKKTAVTGQYQNPSDLTIAYDYSAEIIDYTSGLGTLNQDYLLIPTNGGAIRSYADVLKDAIAIVTTAAKGLMSAADKTKLDGVATNANNYVHPSSHVASMITESTTKRFVTDTQIINWNSKANGSHTHSANDIGETTTKRFVTDVEKQGFWDGTSTVLSTIKKVGIGTAAPLTKLEIKGETGAASVLTIGSSNVISEVGQEIASLQFRQGDGSIGIPDNITSRIVAVSEVSNGAWVGLGFETGAQGVLSEKMRIDKFGNIGIGTTAPLYKLHVVSDSGASFWESSSEDRNNRLIIGANSVSSFIQGNYSSGGTKNISINANGGNVGIGTAPSYKLDVEGSTRFNGNIGFFNTTPIAKKALTQYPSQVGIDTTWGGNEIEALETTRDSLQEVIDALKAYGLLS
ncbi:MAG: hypothetical protein JEY96_17035 [Bacteroidales bacterium]|nr:hypothetical protein [Bacteroidales bacterium]